jgi:predicted transposase/invertase (TIGR01784 family)
MFLHDSRNAILKAKQQGLEEGERKGLEKGRREQALAIASSLLDVLDLETISQKTGLTITEIEHLR